MSIDNKTVKDIAFLSRIEISDEDLENTSQELSNIISWIEQLFEVNVDDVDPMVSVAKMNLRKRKDEALNNNTAQEVLLNAPDSDDNCFLVPKVVE